MDYSETNLSPAVSFARMTDSLPKETTILTRRDIVRLSARMAPDAAEPDAKRGAAAREMVESDTRPRCASGSAYLTQHLHLNIFTLILQTQQ